MPDNVYMPPEKAIIEKSPESGDFDVIFLYLESTVSIIVQASSSQLPSKSSTSPLSQRDARSGVIGICASTGRAYLAAVSSVLPLP